MGTITAFDLGSAFPARATRLMPSGLDIAHRRGGYRDPEPGRSSSHGSATSRNATWRQEFEPLNQAREVIAAYIDHYHHRPCSRLDDKTPREVRATSNDALGALQNIAA